VVRAAVLVQLQQVLRVALVTLPHNLRLKEVTVATALVMVAAAVVALGQWVQMQAPILEVMAVQARLLQLQVHR